MRDIINTNNKGKLHGYNEWYWGELRNKLLIRVNWKNDKCIGYEESHSIKKTNFYIR